MRASATRWEIGLSANLSRPLRSNRASDAGYCAFRARAIAETAFLMQSPNVQRLASVAGATPSLRACRLQRGVRPGTCNGSGFPTNNGTNPNGLSIDYGLPNDVTSDNAVGKVDYQTSIDRNTLSGIYFFGNNTGTVSDANRAADQMAHPDSHSRPGVGRAAGRTAERSAGSTKPASATTASTSRPSPNDHNTPAPAYGLNTGVTNPLYWRPAAHQYLADLHFPAGTRRIQLAEGPGSGHAVPVRRSRFLHRRQARHSSSAARFTAISFTGAAYGGGRGSIKFLRWKLRRRQFTPLEDFFAGLPASTAAC